MPVGNFKGHLIRLGTAGFDVATGTDFSGAFPDATTKFEAVILEYGAEGSAKKLVAGLINGEVALQFEPESDAQRIFLLERMRQNIEFLWRRDPDPATPVSDDNPEIRGTVLIHTAGGIGAGHGAVEQDSITYRFQPGAIMKRAGADIELN